MEFTIKEAFEIKKHYQPILIGTSLGSRLYEITDLFVCRKGHDKETAAIVKSLDFDGKQTMVKVKDESAKEFEVYAYYTDNVTIMWDEIDAVLTDKNLDKIYSTQ